ncbi:MAG: hypothetical protein AABX05_06200 [Nanoarchaeota archaeon]
MAVNKKDLSFLERLLMKRKEKLMDEYFTIGIFTLALLGFGGVGIYAAVERERDMTLLYGALAVTSGIISCGSIRKAQKYSESISRLEQTIEQQKEEGTDHQPYHS